MRKNKSGQAPAVQTGQLPTGSSGAGNGAKGAPKANQTCARPTGGSGAEKGAKGVPKVSQNGARPTGDSGAGKGVKGAPKAGGRRPLGACARALLRALAVYAAYMAAMLGAVFGVAAALPAALRALGAPDTLAAGASSASGLLASLLVLLGGLLASRRWRAPRASDGRWTGIGALIGAAIPAALTALALALDSMRLDNPLSAPSLSVSLPISLATVLASAFASEVFVRRILYDAVEQRHGRRCAYLAALALAALNVLTSGSRAFPAAYFGAALTAAAGCKLYERGGLRASAAMTAALNLWTHCLFGWPSAGESAGGALYALYSVSDAWLTGGDAGMAAGWAYAVCAAIAAGILFRGELSRGLSRLRRRGASSPDSGGKPPAGSEGH